ncbi:hypothetical protein NPIL_339561 [Nephila pilipes]|uniref:Uncharacterized protein n=1 Tax=Nephila pilipes TaxID=299642 RepID=A0A8X6NAJ3_NEPPI|nr:hypothetical protein NPIL_339561 [Nephila pilipes]
MRRVISENAIKYTLKTYHCSVCPMHQDDKYYKVDKDISEGNSEYIRCKLPCALNTSLINPQLLMVLANISDISFPNPCGFPRCLSIPDPPFPCSASWTFIVLPCMLPSSVSSLFRTGTLSTDMVPSNECADFSKLTSIPHPAILACW